MDDKVLELMTKMYSEMQEMNKSLNSRMDSMSNEIQEVKNIQLRMEQNLGSKIEALFDAREVQIDVDEKVATNLQRVESKVDKLEWKVIRSNLSDADYRKEN